MEGNIDYLVDRIRTAGVGVYASAVRVAVQVA